MMNCCSCKKEISRGKILDIKVTPIDYYKPVDIEKIELKYKRVLIYCPKCFKVVMNFIDKKDSG